MEHKSVSELLDTKVSQIITNPALDSLPHTTTVAKALQELASNNYLSIPIEDKQKGEFLGVFDVLGVVAFLVKTCKDLNKIHPEKFIDAPVTDALNVSKKENDFAIIDANTTLKTLLADHFAKGTHRVGVRASSSSDSKQKVHSIITQTDVLIYFSKHLSQLESIAHLTIQHLKLVKEWVIFVQSKERALKAFIKMDEHDLSAVAIVDLQDHLVGNLSASDLRGIQSKDFVRLLSLPVLDFVAQQKQNNNDKSHLGLCKGTDTYSDVIKMLVDQKVHRLWVVDGQLKPIGVVSLTDMCSALLSASQNHQK